MHANDASRRHSAVIVYHTDYPAEENTPADKKLLLRLRIKRPSSFLSLADKARWQSRTHHSPLTSLMLSLSRTDRGKIISSCQSYFYRGKTHMDGPRDGCERSGAFGCQTFALQSSKNVLHIIVICDLLSFDCNSMPSIAKKCLHDQHHKHQQDQNNCFMKNPSSMHLQA